MGQLALQRVVVRMLYDASFARRVYADPGVATAGCALDAMELRWLTAPDPRAYETDPLRRSRSLTDLLEEFAVSVARLVREGDVATGWRRLDAFFSSDEFHSTLQSGGSLAGGFARWAALQTSDDLTRGWIAIDAALARARRPGPARAGEAELALAQGVEIIVVPEGSSEAYGQALASLRTYAEGPVVAALDPAASLDACSSGAGLEGVLVDGRSAELRLETLGHELAQLLSFCADGASLAALTARGASLGASPEECAQVVETFAGDGVLVVGRGRA